MRATRRLQAMATVVLVCACNPTSSEQSQAQESPGGKADVFGEDDRVERHALQPGDIRVDFAQASAALVPLERLRRDGEDWSHRGQELGVRRSLCEDEAFWAQPALADCSATLVADDLVVTSGHCLADKGSTETSDDARRKCEGTAIVFDFAYLEPEDELNALPGSNVFQCAEVLALENTLESATGREHDYAVLRLDRPVEGRAPAPLRAGGALAPGETVVQVGHPSGLPQKITDGTVREKIDCRPHDGFAFEADLLGGNSGGGVFDLANEALAGIPSHYNGHNYVAGPQGCQVLAVCGENVQCSSLPGAYDTSTLISRLAPEIVERFEIVDVGETGVQDPPECIDDVETDGGFDSGGFMGGGTGTD